LQQIKNATERKKRHLQLIQNLEQKIRAGKADFVFEIDKLENDNALKLFQNKISADQSLEFDWVALINALNRLPFTIT
jgi:hypothetical protein